MLAAVAPADVATMQEGRDATELDIAQVQLSGVVSGGFELTRRVVTALDRNQESRLQLASNCWDFTCIPCY